MENVIEEVIETERSYVTQLNILVEFYQKPLQGPMAAKLKVKPKRVPAMFSNLQSIYTLNKKLLETLEEATPRTALTVATTFLEFTPYLKLYETYVNNYGNALVALGKSARQKKFSDWLESQRKASGNPNPIASLLITPVQRCPRYELLLADLLRKSSNSKEQAKLNEALNMIKATNKNINESQRHAEHVQKVWEVQEAFSLTSLPETLVSPSRKLLHEGKLVQLQDASVWSSTQLPVHAFLFSDIFLCGYIGQSVKNYSKVIRGKMQVVKDKVRGYDAPVSGLSNSSGSWSTQPGGISSRKFLTFKLIGLTDCQLEEDLQDTSRGSGKDSKEKEEKKEEKKKSKEKKENAGGPPFAIYEPATDKRHRFQASTLEDRAKWIEALKAAIARHNESKAARSKLSKGTISSRKLSYFFFHTYLGKTLVIVGAIIALMVIGFLLFNLWLLLFLIKK